MILKRLGPGLLYAGAAIGISHLVQSTRAGATYGLDLIPVILIIHLVKYPFFAVGPLYRLNTGKSLLTGYAGLGKWTLYVIGILSLLTASIVLAAIAMVTGGLFINLLNLDIPLWSATGALLLPGFVILYHDRVTQLNRFVKWIIVFLAICTLICVILAAPTLPWTSFAFGKHFQLSEHTDILFLIALAGWMPAPMDIVVWQSLWSEGKAFDFRKNAWFDFQWGYWSTAVMAGLFVLLGAATFFLSTVEMERSAVAFTGQLIELYTQNMGAWSAPFIATAAFLTMLSTTITVMDAYPRVVNRVAKELPSIPQIPYRYALLVMAASAMLIMVFFPGRNMKAFVDFVTGVSFLSTPLLAWIHFRLLQKHRLGAGWQRQWAKVGLILLTGFALYYLWLMT